MLKGNRKLDKVEFTIFRKMESIQYVLSLEIIPFTLMTFDTFMEKPFQANTLTNHTICAYEVFYYKTYERHDDL